MMNLLGKILGWISTASKQLFSIFRSCLPRNGADVADSDDNDNDLRAVIDPREYFAAAEANHDDDEEEERPVEPFVEEPAQGQGLDAAPDEAALPPEDAAVVVEDMDTRIDRYYIEEFKPMLDKLSSDWGLSLNDETMWCLLVLRPAYRRQLIQIIEEVRFRDDKKLLYARMSSKTSFGALGLPLDEVVSCLTELGAALSACPALERLYLHLTYQSDFSTMDETICRIIGMLQQVEHVNFTCNRADEDAPGPALVLATLAALPALKTFTFSVHQPLWISCVCHAMKNSISLTHFSLRANSKSPLLSMTALEADAIAELLHQDTLTAFHLAKMRFINNQTSRLLGNAIVSSSNLSSLWLSDLCFREDGALLYEILGAGLSGMDMVRLTVDLGEFKQDGRRYHRITTSGCLAVILGELQTHAKLCRLDLPSCTWTVRLGQALADCIINCTALSHLAVGIGYIHGGNECAFSAFGLALEHSSVTSLTLTLRGLVDKAFVAIANGAARNSTTDFVRMDSKDLSMETASTLCHVMYSNEAQGMLILCDESQGYYKDDLTTACCAKIMESISQCFGQALIIFPRRECEKMLQLQTYVSSMSRLNMTGRRYITRPNDPDYRKHAVQVLAAVNDSLDCLYLHLHEIAMLFDRHDDAAKPV